MNTNYTVDAGSVRMLDEALREYRRVTRRSDEYIVNKVARNVGMRAMHNTIFADKGKLAMELGSTVTPTGKYSTSRKGLTSTAFVRFIAECKRRGVTIPPKSMLAAAVAAYVKKTLRSVKFMRGGWRPPWRF